MKFQLTNEHINKGKRGTRSCPIALAIREVLKEPKYKYISVGMFNLTFLICGDVAESKKIDLSEDVMAFIRAYDSYLDLLLFEPNNKEKIALYKSRLVPIEFEIEINELRS